MKTVVIPASPKKYQVMVWRKSQSRWQRFVGSSTFCLNIKNLYKSRGYEVIGVDQWPEE